MASASVKVALREGGAVVVRAASVDAVVPVGEPVAGGDPGGLVDPVVACIGDDVGVEVRPVPGVLKGGIEPVRAVLPPQPSRPTSSTSAGAICGSGRRLTDRDGSRIRNQRHPACGQPCRTGRVCLTRRKPLRPSTCAPTHRAPSPATCGKSRIRDTTAVLTARSSGHARACGSAAVRLGPVAAATTPASSGRGQALPSKNARSQDAGAVCRSRNVKMRSHPSRAASST